MNIEIFIGTFHDEMFPAASIRTSSPEISISIMLLAQIYYKQSLYQVPHGTGLSKCKWKKKNLNFSYISRVTTKGVQEERGQEEEEK